MLTNVQGKGEKRAGRWYALALAGLMFGLGGCATSKEGEGTTADASAVSTPGRQTGQSQLHPSARVVRGPSSQATPGLGHRRKADGCQIRGLLPDPACTPGAIFTSATASQVCTPGYSQSVRNVPRSLKQSVYAEYGIESHTPGSYEVDHLVSLELGGNNSIANLWPEISPGYHEKDGIENRLHDAVCAGSVSLHAAQDEIARDWRHTFVGAPSAGGRATQPTPSTPTRAPASSTPTSSTAADFCTTHKCIASFAEGRGTIVQCADGEWSHSGGRPGVCSRHGGPR
jgi:hypothetical protein